MYIRISFGLPCGSAGKESTCNVGDLGSIPGLGRSPGEGKGYPLQYSGLENSMDCRRVDTTERLSLSNISSTFVKKEAYDKHCFPFCFSLNICCSTFFVSGSFFTPFPHSFLQFHILFSDGYPFFPCQSPYYRTSGGGL